jgi:predicted NAD-dependent protein-ADP-ribosyltransferase YbiA (DUF1768 family)
VQGNPKKTNLDDKLKQVIANIEARERRVISKEEVERWRHTIIAEVTMQKMNIYQLFNYYLHQEYINTVRTAVEKAYNAKILQGNNEVLINALLATGNVPILYMSGNPVLGIGPDRNGMNLVGRNLMQIRHNLRVQRREMAVEQQRLAEEEIVWTMYKAYKILHEELRNDNTLREYKDKSAGQIVDEYEGDLTFEDKIKPSILQMYRRDQFPSFKREIESPGALVRSIRRTGVREIAVKKTNQRETIILEMYTAYLIRKQNEHQGIQMSEEEVTRAANQLLSASPSPQAYFDLRKRVVALFEAGQLSSNLSDSIDAVTIPSTREIESAEQPSQVSIKEDSSSSSSVEDANPLKVLLAPDKRAEKISLIQRLQKYTGKSAAKYKKYDIDMLKRKIAEYEPQYDATLQKHQDAAKRPRKGAGHWSVKIHHRNNRKEEIDWHSRDRPTNEDKEDIVRDYNARDGPQIKTGQIVVRWIPAHVSEEISLSGSNSAEEVVIEDTQYVKPIGKPLEIYPQPNDNAAEYKSLSPLYDEAGIEIDNLTYPSVSIYITVMLITKTGVRQNLNERQTTFSRGTAIIKAREMIQISSGFQKGHNDEFYAPDQAVAIYDRVNKASWEELLATFMNIALGKKFSNRNMQDLLLLTRTANILWADPNDLFLGSGSPKQQGYNYVGKRLMHIRQELVEQRKNETYPAVRNVESFLKNDPFMESWLRMRLRDMCKVVYKLKQYLWTADKTDEEIDARFTKIVLDEIYQPCSYITALSKDIVNDPPDYFVRLVMGCDGMRLKTDTNYKQEIADIHRELSELDNRFHGRDPVRKPKKTESLEQLLERQQRELVAYQETHPEEAELEEFVAAQKREFDKNVDSPKTESPFVAWAQRSDKNPFEDPFTAQQRDEWTQFLQDLMKPALSERKIAKRMKKLRKAQEKERQVKKNTVALQKRHKNEQKRMLDNLMQPEFGIQERNEKMLEFRAQQAANRNKHLGIRTEPHTAEERQRFARRNQDLTERLQELNTRQKQEINHYLIRMKDIAQVYWNRISVMIYFLVNRMHQTTTQDVKLAIASIELLNSNKVECVQVIANNEDNCIASAIGNLLVGIEKFKYQYGEHIALDRHDIDLAGSIILNRDISEQRVEQAMPEEVEVEQEIIFGDEDLAGGLNSSEEVAEYGDAPSSEGSFGMNAPMVDDLEQIKILLRGIDTRGTADVDDLAPYFMAMITIIKTFPMSKKIKTNRTNFFATIR